MTRRYLAVVAGTMAVSCCFWSLLASGSLAQRTALLGAEARANSRLTLRTNGNSRPVRTLGEPEPIETPSASDKHPSIELPAADSEPVFGTRQPPSPPVLRWQTVDRTPVNQAQHANSAPSSQAVRETGSERPPLKQPARFTPPVEMLPLAETGEPAPHSTTARKSAGSRSNPVRKGLVVSELEQLGLRDGRSGSRPSGVQQAVMNDPRDSPRSQRASYQVPGNGMHDDVPGDYIEHGPEPAAYPADDYDMFYDADCAEPTCGCGDPVCMGCADDGGMFEVASIWLPKPREFTLFSGVHAFKGPLDGGIDQNRDRGNFGIHEGFNWGGVYPWWGHGQVGYQIGYQLVHSQLHGSTTTAGESPTAAAHTQQFVTAGLFRRCKGPGFQYGVVWDMLSDERMGSVDFHQMRAEAGLISHHGSEIGFRAAVHTNDTNSTGTPLRSVDQYLLYYRIHARQGGEARVFGGLTDQGTGIVGSSLLMPLVDRWSFQGGFTYLIPDSAGAAGAQDEAWNLGMNLVWHLGCRARSCHTSLHRPLFDVADNGSLIVQDRP